MPTAGAQPELATFPAVPPARHGETGIAVPPLLAARAFLPAWGIALALHAVLAGIVLFAPPPAPPEEEPLVRMVFVAPPPPPPAPLGAPNGAGTVQAPVKPDPQPQPVARKPEPRVAPKPDRLAHAAKPKPKPKPQPAPQVEAPPQVAPPPAVADVAPGVQAGVVGGEAAGVVGGVEGGVAGGVVGGSGNGPLPAGKVAHPPVLVRRVEPVYPQAARRQQIEGLVVLEAILDREGRVEPDVKVLRSVPLLDREALAAVRKWRFRPARNANGEPVRVILEVPIRFVLR